MVNLWTNFRPGFAGVVEPFRCLTCEVVYYPGTSGTSQQHFKLLVHEKATLPSNLETRRRESQKPAEPNMFVCAVRLPQCKLVFSLRRLTLGPIPYGLPCKRSVRLSNLGHGPAFYRIETAGDQEETVTDKRNGSMASRGTPVSATVPVNISVSPYQGEVPVGGHIDLQVWLHTSVRMNTVSDCPGVLLSYISFIRLVCLYRLRKP